MQRTESIASSGMGHGHTLNLMDTALGSDYEQDDLLQTPSLEAGIFGVLFTLSQEKDQQHIYYHWILLKILLDAWQLFTTIVSPEMGWDINPDSMTWKCVSVLSFGWLKDLGYRWYVAVLYSMAGLLAMNLMLCVWVAWSFKEQKFDYVWPIKVVRGFSYVFLQVFDITSLNFLQLGISCNYMGPAKPHLHMALFPQYSCSLAPHIIHALVSGLLLLLFVVVAMLVNMSEVDVNPTSKAPQGLGHSGAEVTAFGIKALMTLVGVFLGWPKVAAVAYCILAAWLTWEYLRWVPHLLTWVNCLKGGVALAMFGVALLQLAVVLLAHGPGGAGDGADAARRMTLLMAVGLGPVFLVGAVATYLRTKLFTSAVVKAFKNADYDAIKPQDIYHFAHPRDVEVAARSARVWTDLYALEKTAVHRAEEIIKAGVALFPDSAFVALVYANFMLDMLGFSQTGARQLESVRKLSPSLVCRFMLFVRQQQATQKAASSTVGKGGNMDLLGYVEYQRKQRMVLRHHKDALQAMANFWRILGTSSISFSSLSKSLEDIDTSISQAETAYRVVLELYNSSPRLVRLYARFLETIKQDPWTAAQYHAAAERLEENKEEDGQGPSLPDGTPISRMDDVEKGVLVVNAFGDIQVANRKLHNMFGYKKGDLDGKNVTVLMPPHEAKRHPGLMRRYIDSGDKVAPYFRHPVLGVHKERVAFTVRIAVSRASGLGEDSVFIGLIEAVPAEAGVGRVWVTPEGIIVCCDPGFVTCFGYHPDDVIGVQLDKLLRTGGSEMERALLADIWMASKVKHDNQEYVQKLLASATCYGSSTTDQPVDDRNQCSVLHKYDFAKEVRISVLSDMTKSNIFEVRMKLISNEPQLLMVVERKGAIRHMSGDLAKVLGVGIGDGSQRGRQGGGGGGGDRGGAGNSDNNITEDHVMVELMSDGLQRSLDDFLPTPWKIMHYKYRKYIKGGSPNLSGAWGCRAVTDESSNTLGPTMQLVGVHGRPVFVHVKVASRDHQGDITHVVRMTRSSKEQAIAERRLRLRISEDGVVQELVRPGGFEATGSTPAAAQGAFPELFGFPPEQLLGCRLWDFVSLPSEPRGGGRPSKSQVPQPPPTCEFIAEAEALVHGGGGGGRGLAAGGGVGSGMSDSGCGGGDGRHGSAAPAWTNHKELDSHMLYLMITSTLQTPGVSWRVNVLPPSATLESATMGPERAAAVLARRTKRAVLRLDVTLPPPDSVATHGSGNLLIYAELWGAEAVTGVLEVDGTGKVMGILEEEVRPPGLLFGLPKEDILGAQLGALLHFRPGQSPVGLLTDSGIAKKSALKDTGRKGKIIDKVGPVHHLDGFHRDHQPLHLTVQVVGKLGPGNPVIAVIRFLVPKPAGKRSIMRLTGPGAVPAAAAVVGVGPASVAGSAGNGYLPPWDRVQMSSPGMELPLWQPAAGPSLQLPPSASGRGLPQGLHDACLSRNEVHEESQRRGASGAPLGGGGGSPGTNKPMMCTAEPTDGRATLTGVSGDGAGAGGEFARPSLAAAMSAESLVAPPQPSQQPALLIDSGTTAAATPAAGKTSHDQQAVMSLPGSTALAAAAVRVISSRSLQLASSSVSAAPLPAPPATVAAAAGAAAATRAFTMGDSSPLKPASPPVAGPSKRPLVSASPRGAANLGEAADGRASRTQLPDMDMDEEGLPRAAEQLQFRVGRGVATEERRQAGGPGGLTLVGAMKALREGGSGDCKGVSKWIASGGQFFKNRTQSQLEAELDAEEDDDDDEDCSIGATSRAPSSRVMSPMSSRFVNEGGTDEQQYEEGRGERGFHYQQQNLRHRLRHGSGQPPPAHGGDGGDSDLGPGDGGPPLHPYLNGGFDVPDAVNMGRSTFWEGMTEEQLQEEMEGGQGGMLPELEHPGMAKPPPAADVADDRSDGGESAYSGISGISGLSDPDTPADFKRGKRYRKLVKLMDSPEAQRTVVRMRMHTALTMFIASTIHIVCFAFVITAVKRQGQALDNLADAGHSRVHLQRILVETRALDQAYRGKGSNATYSSADLQALASSIMDNCQKFRSINNLILSKLAGDTEDLYYGREALVWSGINATTRLPYYDSMTLWDLVTRIFVSAKTVFQSHEDWYEQGINVSTTAAGAFLLNSGQAFVPGANEVHNALLGVAVRRTNTVNMLQLIFLIVEGFLVTLISAMILVHILRSVCDQRYQLYETFLKIPVGLTRALASQTTHLLDDDESDDDEEEGSQNQENAEDGNTLAPRRKALFEDGNGGGGANGQDHGSELGAGGGGGRNCHTSMGSDPAGKANGGATSRGKQRRSSIGPGGMIRQNDESARGLLANAAANRARGNGGAGGGGAPSASLYNPSLAASGVGILSSHYSLSVNDRNIPRQRPEGLWGRFFGKFGRSNAVSPVPLLSGVPLGIQEGATRRTLERNSRIPQATLVYICCYSLLIILFYSVSYAVLLGINDMVAFQGVAEHNTDRTYRTVFYAQELAAEEDVTLMSRRVQDLRGSAIALRDAYYTLRMGVTAWTAVGRGVEQFPHVRSRGTVKETPAMFRLFYSDDQCLRLAEHLPCPPITYRFYHIVRAGVDGMLTQLLLEVKSLADRADAAIVTNTSKPDLASPEWDYIYNVGTEDLHDGNQRIVVQHMQDIRKVFNAIVVLHVILFLLLLVVFLAFLMAIYLPLLRRMAKEKRRIAEMMSQLPTELDVMRLVSTALVGPKASSRSLRSKLRAGSASSRRNLARSDNLETQPSFGAAIRAGSTPSVGNGTLALPSEASVGVLGGGSGGGGNSALKTCDGTLGTGDDAYHAWKDILNRTTNANSITKSDMATLASKKSFARLQ